MSGKFDPAEHERKLKERLEKLADEVYDLEDKNKAREEMIKSQLAITKTKAALTNVKLAQDKMQSLPADSNTKLGSGYFMKYCSNCHGLEYDSRGRTSRGPPLGLIYGRISGSDFHYMRYSSPMLQSKIIWNSKNLRRWLYDPSRVIPNSKCGLNPVEEDSEAYDLVQYLKEFTIYNYQKLKNTVPPPAILNDYQFETEEREKYLKK